MDQTLLYAMIAVGIMLVVGFPVHEFSHALAAYRLGDSTARWQGRLTLDPRVHFDTVGGLMLVLSALLSRGSFFFGYAKPTPVNPMNLSGGRRGEALVAAAGPVSNLVMAAIVAVPLRLVIDSPELALQVQASEPLRLIVNVAYYFIVINVMLCLFNLLPVPPLDGSSAIGVLLRDDQAGALQNAMRSPAFALIGMLVAWKLFPALFAPVFRLALGLLYPGSGWS
jgi:Zn-dependent protease